MFATRIILVTAAAISLAGFQSSANAGGITVKHGDLDLTSAAGRATLDDRIATAARDYCRKANTIATGALVQDRACRIEVSAALKRQVETAFARSGDAKLAQAVGKSSTVSQ